MRVDADLGKRLLAVSRDMRVKNFRLLPLQMNRAGRRSHTALSKAAEAESAARHSKRRHLAGIDVKDHVGWVIASDRVIRYRPRAEGIGKPIVGFNEGVKKNECGRLAGKRICSA